MLNRAAVRIVRDVREWLSDQDYHDVAEEDWRSDGNALGSLEMLLQARQDWLNSPDPTLWKTGDAHRLLIDAAAPRLTDAYRLTEHGPGVVKILVDFLDDTDRFHPASMRVTTLRKELDRAAAKFPAAMADESVWRMAKRIFMAMRADGVDPADDTAVDTWAAAFSTAPAERRRAVLGVLLDRQPELLTAQFVIRDNQVAAIAPGAPIPAQFRRHDPDTCECCLDAAANPPIALPAVDELADAARESTLLRTMIGCGRWAAAGRAVTKHGFPSPADTRSLAAAIGMAVRASVRDPRDHLGLIRAWWLALDVEVLRLHRTKVVAGPALAALEKAMAGGTDPDHTLRLWKDIADIAVSGPTQLATKDTARTGLGEFSRPWGPRALGELYRMNRSVEVEDLVDTLVTDYHGPLADDVLAMMTGAAVRNGLLAATEASMVTVTVPTGAEIDPGIASTIDGSGGLLGDPGWAVTPVAGTLVELTPLGRYFVRLNLLAEGTHAPLLEPTP
ncbi:hypothetical protein KIPE111705_39710 [Kibdelosporangium persicum]|uniref:TIGR02677 family protein n=1 Tax=Kibdelosporangium persicum TaxID=2698649 RepID=A0ABX2FBP9_9PSEU|nr:hypothetical protein [Kibdelosporangium persicum]NRN68722.1 hypothetical protein [Kibdelosporangium persicum]